MVGWADIFSRQVYRDIIIHAFKYCREHKGMELFDYVIMTNHVHCIVRSKREELSNLVRDFKKYTSKKILAEVESNNQESRKEWLKMIFTYHAKFNKRAGKQQLWTHENHAVELSSNEMINSRVDYIHENPVRAGIVDSAEDYLYSSARNYSDRTALIDVDDL